MNDHDNHNSERRAQGQAESTQHSLLGVLFATAALVCGGCVGDDDVAWGDSDHRESAGDTYEDDDFPIGRSFECDESLLLEYLEEEGVEDCDDLLDWERRDVSERYEERSSVETETETETEAEELAHERVQ